MKTKRAHVWRIAPVDGGDLTYSVDLHYSDGGVVRLTPEVLRSIDHVRQTGHAVKDTDYDANGKKKRAKKEKN